MSLDEALGILMSGFLRGGVGFLKGTGEIIKGSSSVNREVRVGVTHVICHLVTFNHKLTVYHNILGIRYICTNSWKCMAREKY